MSHAVKFPELISALQFSREYQPTFRQLKSEALRPVVEAYAATMDRQMMSLALVTNLSFFVAIGSRAAGPVPFEDGRPEIDVYKALGDGGLPEFYANVDKYESRFFGQSSDHQASIAFNIGASLVESYLGASNTSGQRMNTNVVINGIQNIFYSMVLSSFVAFESLAADVWVEAINLDPKQYAETKGDASKKPVYISDIEDFGYDLRDRMGEFLRTTKRETFDTLSGISKAYKSSFPAAYKPHDDLYLTSQIRHLIAHRSGRIDKNFKEEVEGWLEYGQLPLDSTLTLSGKQVANLITPCVQSAVQIIIEMDDWAARYEKRAKKGD